MKLAIIYHSETGNTKKAAEFVLKGMQRVEGIEAKAFSIDAVDEAYVKEAKGIVFGAPTYYADTPGRCCKKTERNFPLCLFLSIFLKNGLNAEQQIPIGRERPIAFRRVEL